MTRHVLMLIPAALLATLASAQTSVTVFPDNKQLSYASSVRLSQLSQSLLFDLNSTSQCTVEWAYTSLHRAEARDRSSLLSELSNGAHPDLIDAVNAVPAHPFISYTLDFDLVRIQPEKNPLITGDYLLRRSCGQPEVLILSYQYGAARSEWHSRTGVDELMSRIGWEFRGEVTVIAPFSLSSYPVNTFDAQYVNTPKRAIVWLNDAPTEELNQKMLSELREWGALWYAQ